MSGRDEKGVHRYDPPRCRGQSRSHRVDRGGDLPGPQGSPHSGSLLCEGARSYLRGEWPYYEDEGPNNPLPDLIVLDLWLPDGNGFELLRWIAERERLKHIPVVLFTASTDPDHALLAKELGVRRYLQKPAAFGKLVTVIKEELQAADERNVSGSMSGSAVR